MDLITSAAQAAAGSAPVIGLLFDRIVHSFSRCSVARDCLATAAFAGCLLLGGDASAQTIVRTGTYTGNGTAGRNITGIGFQPDVVIIKAANNKEAYCRTAEMPITYSKKLGGNGAFDTGKISSLDADGFTIGSVAEINASGIAYYWVAMRAGTGHLKTGLYVGDGAALHAIAGLGFTPEAVLVLPQTTEIPHLRTADYLPGYSTPLTASAPVTDGIMALDADGFTVGTNNVANKFGDVYYYVAWNAASGLVGNGTYMGDLSATRTITVAGMQPEFLLVRGSPLSPVDAVFRTASMPGDFSLFYDNKAGRAGVVQSLLPTGFQIGNDPTVNQALANFRWLAMANAPVSTDIGVTITVDEAAPREGDSVAYLVNVANLGLVAATNVHITDLLPAGLTFQSATASKGNYVSPSGVWQIGSLAAGERHYLFLVAGCNAGTAGSTITNSATVTGLSEADPNPGNDSASVDITVGSGSVVVATADLQIAANVDDAAPNEGQQVTFTVTLANAGPDGATGVTVADLLPAGLLFVSASASQGAYDDQTGNWLVGGVANGAGASLAIVAAVEAGTAGTARRSTAVITGADQRDPDPRNNFAGVELRVTGADLVVTDVVSDIAPDEGAVIAYTVGVTNAGPQDATGVAITALVPAGVTLLGAAPSQGSFDSGTGAWAVGALNAANGATLVLTGRVNAGTSGATLAGTALVTALDQVDPNAANNSAGAVLTVGAPLVVVGNADLKLTLDVDRPAPREGQSVNYTLTLTNAGPDPATGIAVSAALPTGLTFVSATPTQGTYNQGTGAWTVGNLAATGARTLSITATVGAGTAGGTLTVTAIVSGSGQSDPLPLDNTASAFVYVLEPLADPGLHLLVTTGDTKTVLPGVLAQTTVLAFSLANPGALADTLRGLTLTNLTSGSGTQAQRDAEWQTLSVTARRRSGGLVLTAAPMTFTAGAAQMSGVKWAIPAGDTLDVTVRSGPSLVCRDGARLQLGIAQVSHLQLNGTPTRLGAWPLTSGHRLEIDGFVAAQAVVHAVPTRLLGVGSQRNLALDVTLPANGYLSDVIQGLAVSNSGSAVPGEDIAAVEAWLDNGDGAFSSVADTRLGTLAYSGAFWQLSGLNVAVPVGGRRLFFSVDISEAARPSRDIRLAIPVDQGPAVNMASSNDGPVDASLENPSTLGISATDRIILTSERIVPGLASPGDADLPLVQMVLANTYGAEQRLRTLVVTNATSGGSGATVAQLDGVLHRAALRLDANGDGVLGSTATDPVLATGTFTAGRAAFSGLDLAMAPGSGTRLFVTADLSLTNTADGDRVRAQVAAGTDVEVSGASVVAGWPVDSGATWTVDGMVAEQVKVGEVSVLTLGPGEGPALALDITVPANGYRTDVLTGLTLTNEGTARAVDIAQAELWSDGGNGLFDAGASDDVKLGDLVINGTTWSSTILGAPIGSAGLRLFASLSVAATPRDSMTVQLAVPVNGFTVSSENDGPIDRRVSAGGTLVISTSPLLSTLAIVGSATNVGGTSQVRMTVRNAGSETVADIVPVLAVTEGPGSAVLGTPVPATVPSLDPGQSAVLTWNLTATGAGSITLEGNAEGLVAGGQARRSIVTRTSSHTIYIPVPQLDLYPTVNLPFTINRGQSGLVPLTLTFVNPGGDLVADARLTALRIRLLQTPAGPGIVPANLLSRVVVSEGTDTYLDLTSLPTTGETVDLVLSRPARVTGNEPVTLGLRFDLQTSVAAPSFLLSVEDAAWLTGIDAVDGHTVPVMLGSGTFPVRTGMANLVSPAAGLSVAIANPGPHAAVPGMSGVTLAEIQLANSSTDAGSSAVQLGSLTLILRDGEGAPLAAAADILARVRLVSAFQEHFSGPPVVQADSILVFNLSTPVTVPGGASLGLRVLADLAADAPLGRLAPVLGDANSFDARDANMNNAVPVVLGADPVGAPLDIVAPATGITVAGAGSLPEVLPRGARDQVALLLRLATPGDPARSPVRCDSLMLRFFGSGRSPLDPGLMLDRIRVMRGTSVVGTAIDPSASSGVFALPLGGMLIAPEDTAALSVRLDFSGGAPVGDFEVVLDGAGIFVADAVTGGAIAVMPAGGGSLYFTSGRTRLVVPGDELLASGRSQMPPLLAPRAEAYPVLNLTMTNPALPGSSPLSVRSVVLELVTGDGTVPTLDAALDRVLAKSIADTTIGSAVPASAATSVTVPLTTPLIVPAGQSAVLTIAVAIRSGAPPGRLRLRVPDGGIGATQAADASLVVTVRAANGSAYPFETEVGNVAMADLADSYINFPNPFAAGRETTTFAYSLPAEADVTLRLLTPYGEPVLTLRQDMRRAAGFYQDDVWDGLNGRGVTVRSGVYLAELLVRFADGTGERLLRKVAVVR